MERDLELEPAVRREIEFGALLHDVGKMTIPAEILNKPAALSAEEMATVTPEKSWQFAVAGGVLMSLAAAMLVFV